ncbi:MAG: marine proteobacterial sortase target protein [Robiginitomaculum sp.]|nr:marine proteobacterial sortase target protein [Robiginitomaculum sp.]
MHINFISKFRRFVLFSAITALSFWMISCSAAAEQPIMEMDDVQSGTLMFRTDIAGKYISAPALATDVQIDVTGPIIRARVTQKFVNTSQNRLEAIYLFPLPDEAAVDRLVMIVGGRVIEGKVQERQQARRTYETAKEAGQKAALVEQQRPNMFINSVANIGPGETIIIQIEYQDKVRLQDGRYSLHFPLVVAPRFSPDKNELLLASQLSGSQTPIGVSLKVNLNTGFALSQLTSSSHKINISGETQKTITIDDEVIADRDFTLQWIPKVSGKPALALFSEQKDGETYLLAIVQAPTGMGSNPSSIAREMVFVIDNSGSMAGKSIRQARKALITGLGRLDERDDFNVIAFDNETEKLFEQSVSATAENIRRAKHFISKLDGDGGTVMLPALSAAFDTPRTQSSNKLRQLVFITDGQISNEGELFSLIAENLGNSRLFTIGIGSAPNRYFLSRAAKLGRGTDTIISDLNKVAAEMTRVFAKLEKPIMQNLAVKFTGIVPKDVSPNPLPDLYNNDPVIILAKFTSKPQDMVLSGQLSHSNWVANLSLSSAKPGTGISQLWARAKIKSLEEGRFRGKPVEQINQQILQISLDHHLVSRLTSLVAVDITPITPDDTTLETVMIPLHLPDGWGDMREKITFKPKPVTSAPSLRRSGITLPATASPHEIQIILGLLIIALGLSLLASLLRRKAQK